MGTQIWCLIGEAICNIVRVKPKAGPKDMPIPMNTREASMVQCRTTVLLWIAIDETGTKFLLTECCHLG